MIFPMSTQQPWLDHKPWAKNAITSGSGRALWVMWGFALFWNLLTLPLLFQFHEIWEKVQREPVTAVAFLFPLIGLGLVVAAVIATLRKRRFGQTPLVMNPFPGSLGGQVGGRINTHIPFDSQRKFKVSLGCLHSRISGSGKTVVAVNRWCGRVRASATATAECMAPRCNFALTFPPICRRRSLARVATTIYGGCA
jgi:hypothetical protein